MVATQVHENMADSVLPESLEEGKRRRVPILPSIHILHKFWQSTTYTMMDI